MLLPRIPASYFGGVLGLVGLGNAWRAASLVWSAPSEVGEVLMAGAAVTLAILVVLYIAKWLQAPDEALAELGHPVQCCFVGLIGVAAMLVAMGALPYSRQTAELLYVAGAAFTLVFGLWRTGLLWRGERDHGATTAVLYLPLVAGTFITAAGSAALGHPDWWQLAFGAAFSRGLPSNPCCCIAF